MKYCIVWLKTGQTVLKKNSRKEEIMKKLILFVCTGVLVLGLTACGKGATEDNLTSGASQETSQEERSEEHTSELQSP